MKAKKFFGQIVLDVNANEIGKVDDIEFDEETGQISAIEVSHRNGAIRGSDKIEVSYEDILKIGEYILLKNEIKKE